MMEGEHTATHTEQELSNGILKSKTHTEGDSHQALPPEEVITDTVDVTRTEEDDTRGAGRQVHEVELENGGNESVSAQALSGLLKQQKSVYSLDCLSKHFNGDVLKVAGKCWEQIQGSIQQALQSKYAMVLSEFKVTDRLTELDRLKEESDPSQPTWRPSGIADVDASEAEGVELRTKIIPQFEVEYEKVERISSEIQRLLKERQQQLQDLETDIKQEMCQLNSDIVR